MTTIIFTSILIVGAVTVFCVATFLMMAFFNESVDFGVGIAAIAATALFVLLFVTGTPSTEQMVENDYYAMMEDRPKCIDAGDVSLGCKKDYIDWQKGSIEKQHKYDSVKVKLENLQKEILK